MVNLGSLILDQMSISDESKVLLRTRAGEKNTSRVTELK